MTVYWHACGQRYDRTSEATPPRHRMMICERCLEPMPICDNNRHAYTYESITPAWFKRSADMPLQPGTTTRPSLKPCSIVPLFPVAARASATGAEV